MEQVINIYHSLLTLPFITFLFAMYIYTENKNIFYFLHTIHISSAYDIKRGRFTTNKVKRKGTTSNDAGMPYRTNTICLIFLTYFHMISQPRKAIITRKRDYWKKKSNILQIDNIFLCKRITHWSIYVLTSQSQQGKSWSGWSMNVSCLP